MLAPRSTKKFKSARILSGEKTFGFLLGSACMCQWQLASGVPVRHAALRLGRRARGVDPCRAACSAGQKWPAGTTSVLRRRAKRRPATASSPGREGGRSRSRQLGGRASDSPGTAHQRAGFWRSSRARANRRTWKRTAQPHAVHLSAWQMPVYKQLSRTQNDRDRSLFLTVERWSILW